MDPMVKRKHFLWKLCEMAGKVKPCDYYYVSKGYKSKRNLVTGQAYFQLKRAISANFLKNLENAWIPW